MKKKKRNEQTYSETSEETKQQLTSKKEGVDVSVEDNVEAVRLQKSGKNLVKDEERNQGSVDLSVYLKFARAGGLFLFIMVFVVNGIGRAFEVAGNFWLSNWATASVESEMNGTPLTSSQNKFYVNYFALFSMLGVIGLTVRALFLAVHRMRASRNLHNDLTKSVMRAPVSFFDVTPIGRVLNRFAMDMDKLDLELNSQLSQGINTLFQILGALGGILAATKGAFIIALIPSVIVYYLLQKWFRKTSTELQRVTNIACSPIFTDFSQILSGTSTIRAYGEQDRFFENCKYSFDKMNAAYTLTQFTNFWLGIRLDFLGGLVSAFIGGLSVATASTGFIQAGWLGLSLSYSIEVTNYLKWGVRMIANLEATMSSVERILFYTESIESEAPDVIPEKDPKPNTWPSEGIVDISNVSMRYRDGPLVLKDISLNIRGGEKIGVVGRTGSGKSSLMNLLFRICEPELDGGKIEIDNVNTSEIGTDALRLNLSIIPQDPIMFSNTVRYNIDPFNICSDEEILLTLEKVQLSEFIESLPMGLDYMVSEGGDNFSQGQRQLLCIGRALLRKPKVLVMDEATSSIDNETDAKIQTMIRDNFSDATVLTIAHRLNTIMDSDRVLVLDNGHIIEFDSPDMLLSKEDGMFKAMVDKDKEAQSKEN